MGRQNLMNQYKRDRNTPMDLPEVITAPVNVLDHDITVGEIDHYIDRHSKNTPRYVYLENLYQGKHDVFNAPNKEPWKPDNRLAVNFPRYITETFSGYGYGVPIKVTHPDDGINQKIQEFGRKNEITDHNSEMVKRCCIYGHAFELLYQNEWHETKVTACSPKELFVVYSDDLAQRALFAIRYGYRALESNILGEAPTPASFSKPFGEVMFRDRILTFSEGKITGERLNPYGYIPVIEWRLNDDRIGLFEGVAGLIEAYNYTIAEKANDIDSFAEAYLEVLGTEVQEEDVTKLRDNRLINFFGTADPKDIIVQFLQKPTGDQTQENMLDRLERLIYQTSMVANISDEAFGSVASGVSLAYKLQAMSNLATTFDRKIEKSLRKRYKVFCALGTNVPRSSTNAYADIVIQFTRNLPRNLSEEAAIAQGLSGVVSKETQLSVLSVVEDPKEEMERMEKEEEETESEYLFPMARRGPEETESEGKEEEGIDGQ